MSPVAIPPEMGRFEAMTVESLSAEDAALLYAEAPGTQLQIGALCFFEATSLRDRRGRLRLAALRSHVEGRLGAVPRFRQRVAPVLGELAAPMWVDDTGFDIGHHVKAVRLAPPGGGRTLGEFMGLLLSDPLDAAHPLWDIHFVEGLGPVAGVGREGKEAVAVVLRAHHLMADGLALYEAATLLLDPVPQPPRRYGHDWIPDPMPSSVALTVQALRERTRRQADLALTVTKTLGDPRRLLSNTTAAGHILGSAWSGGIRRAPAVPFTGPVGRRRSFAWDSIPMHDIVAIKQACDATVNDVVLAIVTGAVRRALETTGALNPNQPEPRALVPIGASSTTDSRSHNRFSITSVALPVGADDPLERVRLIHSRMHGHPKSPASALVPLMFSLTDIVSPRALRMTVPRVLAHQPLVNLAVSNIPGSRVPLFLWDSPMLTLHPFINVVGNLALIIGVLSYVDELGVGVTVDPDVVGDPREIVARMHEAASELVAAVR